MEDSFQSSWTLAQSIIFDISGHLQRGRNYWLQGNLEKYYWEFEAVGRILFGMLDPDEKLESALKESKIVGYFPVQAQTVEKKKELITLLKDYDGLIMTFIHKHKLDMPPKRDRTRLIA